MLSHMGYNVGHFFNLYHNATRLDDATGHDIQKQWRQAFNKLYMLDPAEVDSFNFDLFPPDIHGISDTPVADYFPFLLKAYPNAKIILTHRNASQWASSRAMHHAGETIPSYFHPMSVHDMVEKFVVGSQRGVPIPREHAGLLMTPNEPHRLASMLSFSIQMTVIRCLVNPSRLFEINFFDKSPELHEQKVRRFMRFMGKNNPTYDEVEALKEIARSHHD
jgi:hypothetical protein